MGNKLDAGDTFPDMALNLVGGSTLRLPGDLKSNYSIILFYRGHW
jgi:peroxiredoxin